MVLSGVHSIEKPKKKQKLGFPIKDFVNGRKNYKGAQPLYDPQKQKTKRQKIKKRKLLREKKQAVYDVR